MAKAVLTNDVAGPLADALGLRDKLAQIRSISVHFRAGQVVTATVELLPTGDEIDAITRLTNGARIDMTSLADSAMRCVEAQA